MEENKSLIISTIVEIIRLFEIKEKTHTFVQAGMRRARLHVANYFGHLSWSSS